MPTDTSKYKNDPLISLLDQLRKKNEELKTLMHTEVIEYQGTVPSRREMISRGKKYTDLKPHVIKMLKMQEKKSVDKPKRSMKLTKVDPRLSKFLRLKERGLPEDVYPDILVMSYFADWVVREGRSDGKNVKLFGKDDPFVRLFKPELSAPGSSSDGENEYGELVERAVLDEAGNPVNPFPVCKHMTIFKDLYPRKRKLVGKVYKDTRDTVTGDEYDTLIPVYQKERDFLTTTLNAARTKYKDTSKKYHELVCKETDAKTLGDGALRSSLVLAKRNLDVATREYKSLLDQNSLPHKL